MRRSIRLLLPTGPASAEARARQLLILISATVVALSGDCFGVAALHGSGSHDSNHAVTPLIHAHAHNDYATPDR